MELEERLVELHGRFPVLAFSEQNLALEPFIAFARIFGDIEIDAHVPQLAHPGMPELVYQTNIGADGNPDPAFARRGSAWHSDSSYKPEPFTYTVMHSHGAVRTESAEQGRRDDLFRYVSRL
jgi:alpha-ketoglutarate-dependent taurine dioxygenase